MLLPGARAPIEGGSSRILGHHAVIAAGGLLKALSVLGYLIMVASLVSLIGMQALLGDGAVYLAVQGVALVLMVWARVTFGKRSFHAAANPTDGELVTSGPYRYIRHPIYAAVLFLVWAGVVSHPGLATFALGGCCTAGAWMRIHVEEELLRDRYPEYAGYAARTRRIIPFLL